MRIALITGASSGLGKEFIRQLRREKLDEIWAIARRKERLLELSGLVPIPVRPISLDLTKPESIDTLERLLAEAQPHIHILINAAGFGKIGNYREISRSDTDRMIDLNCRAAVDVTLLALPYMNKGDRILEICSTAAFQPFPYLNVYAATKSFLYRYSRALRVELMDRRIKVTAVCPYWVKNTEFIPKARETEGSRAIRHFPLASRKETVVRLALSDSRLGLPVSTPGPVCFLHRIAAKFIPGELMMGLWSLIRRL
ncbi:MAG TPA: SDR family NAD(P)-dependent oxidoreductase [Candidatus Scatomonas merdavium]|nr:SDR family NAD(P)-dependent oxidoreductase [Candidatus Scatomonas merdavium]